MFCCINLRPLFGVFLIGGSDNSIPSEPQISRD